VKVICYNSPCACWNIIPLCQSWKLFWIPFDQSFSHLISHLFYEFCFFFRSSHHTTTPHEYYGCSLHWIFPIDFFFFFSIISLSIKIWYKIVSSFNFYFTVTTISLFQSFTLLLVIFFFFFFSFSCYDFYFSFNVCTAFSFSYNNMFNFFFLLFLLQLFCIGKYTRILTILFSTMVYSFNHTTL
jgi:hypothetical protein